MKDCIFRSPCHVFQPAQKCYRQYKVQVLDRTTFAELWMPFRMNICQFEKQLWSMMYVPESTLHDRLMGKVMVGGQNHSEST
jgi:hypothetical protein